MNFVKTEGSFESSSKLANIVYAKYVPIDGEVKAVLQIAHGMAEHKERYENFANFLCSIGVAVYINDHLGHGGSIANNDEKGYFGENGYKTLMEDCAILTDIAKDDYPAIPYFIFGHSMGSFIVRNYLVKYGDNVDAAIICGTGGANPAAGMGISMAKLIGKIKGNDHYRSKFINNLAFGSYNKRFDGRTEFDWLTKDTDIVDAYIADEDCGFLFTVNGFIGLFSALKDANSKETIDNTPNIPIIFIAGQDDPVGNYGKGVLSVYDNMLKSGHDKVDMILYPKARHEILNESDTVNDIYRDIENFINANL